MKYILRIMLSLLFLNIVACVSTTPDGAIIKEGEKEELKDVKIIQNWSGQLQKCGRYFLLARRFRKLTSITT